MEKQIEAVLSNPATFEYWGANQKGMQAAAELDEYAKAHVKDIWEAAGIDAAHFAKGLVDQGAHKQIANRVIEPFSHITTLITASEFGWNNFFALRAHPAAQPEFQVLAYRILDLFMKSEPKALPWGEWHVPRFHEGPEGLGVEGDVKVATARCARLSYLTFDGEHSVEKDIELHDKLAESGHWSPFEHCARATSRDDYAYSNFDNPRVIYGQRGTQVSGLSHWMQYRKQFTEENITDIHHDLVMERKPDWITL